MVQKLMLSRSNILAFISITALYSLFFIPTLLPVVGDAELFPKADASSIISSIKLLFEDPVYNMHNGYHSRVYGWTYFALNFFILVPTIDYADEESIVFSVRFVHFLVSYAACLAFFLVAKEALKNNVLAVFITFIFITLPDTARAFYIIHPEPLGTFFLLMGIYYLLKILDEGEEKEKKFFILMSIFFSLAALTKHPFAIMVFFSLLSLVLCYAKKDSVSFLMIIKSRRFVSAISIFSGIFMVILFMVHPYAIIEFSSFIEYQKRPAAHVGSGKGLIEIWGLWLALLENKVVVILSAVTLLVLLFYRRRVSLLFIYSAVFSAISLLVFVSFQRTFVMMHYIYPLYALWLINIAAALLYIVNKLQISKEKVNCLLVFILLPCVVWASSITLPILSDYVHKLESSTRAAAWAYLNKYPDGTRILYEHNVALPDQFNSSSCHVWRGCANKERVLKFEPDIVVFSPQGNYNKHEMLLDFVKQYDYKLVKSFVSSEQPIGKSMFSAWTNEKGTMLGNEIDVYLSPDFIKGSHRDSLERLK